MKNLKNLMKNAHETTRAICAAYPDADYHVTFAAALRDAWAEPETAAEAWAALDGQQQIDALRRMTRYAMQRDQAETDSRGHCRTGIPEIDRHARFQRNRFAWVQGPDDVDAICNGAWCRMHDYLTDPRRAGDSLRKLEYIAVVTEAQAISRNERRHASALRIDAPTVGDDGSETRREWIDLQASALADRAADPYTRAVTLDRIDHAAADDIDRQIIRLLAMQYSARDIGDILGKSHTAINKRIAKIRQRDAEYMA